MVSGSVAEDDAVENAVASAGEAAGCTRIVTRNLADFAGSPVNETLARDLAGGAFAAGEAAEATYRFNSWRVSYRYQFRDTERWQLWVGVTAKVRDAKIELRQGDTSSQDDDLGFVPLAHFAQKHCGGDLDGLLMELRSVAGRAAS